MDKIEFRRRLQMFSLLEAPGHLLRRNHQRSYEIFVRVVGDDVTRQQIALLVALAKQQGASQSDLVEATGIDKSTMKEMIGRMVSRGWVERERDPQDNRAWVMKITEGGCVLLAERLPRVEEAQRQIIAPLSPVDREIFLRCLRLMAGIDADPGQDVSEDGSI
ncbi:MarR family winged helix-turn-helix transcriptional regulator [Niveispirillum fermenti]|uniref:MarR family winged helix-turn-helix transcriptional regulator n=1 Tax=Niveispirillum fermenti TaxID=1233113 RepID=UPI003A839404